MRSGVTAAVVVLFSVITFLVRVETAEPQEAGPKVKLADELASRNKPPSLVGIRMRPSFGAAFDWSEQARVWNRVKKIIKSPERDWDEVTQSLSSDAYCVTIMTFSGASYNWTVGDVCAAIVSRVLSDAYYNIITPETRHIYSVFRHPEFARNPDDLRRWLDARRGKSISELQADTCDWAIQRLKNPLDEDKDAWNGTERTRWAVAIGKAAEALRSTMKPAQSKGFGVEEIAPYRSSSPDE